MTPVLLLVEDSAVTRAVVHRDLASEDIEIHEAIDGREAIALLATLRPDVVLCDVEMPHVDGYGVLEWIRGHDELAPTPVVFLTALSEPGEVAEALSRGADDYLRKPFADVELVARVRAALRTKRLQDELRARNAELEELVSTDPLTRVRNRRHLSHELDRLVARARRHDVPVAAILIDIDRFKAINDTHGHACGDAVLVAVAQRIASGVRAEDAVGRWGGEEFLVLTADVPTGGAGVVAERLRALVAAEAVEIDGTSVAVTVSVGWSAWRDGDDADAVLARADAALYAAKDAGRDAVRAG